MKWNLYIVFGIRALWSKPITSGDEVYGINLAIFEQNEWVFIFSQFKTYLEDLITVSKKTRCIRTPTSGT